MREGGKGGKRRMHRSAFRASEQGRWIETGGQGGQEIGREEGREGCVDGSPKELGSE